MKANTLNFLFLLFIASYISSCSDDDKPQTIPIVVTNEPSDMTTSTVSISGEITDNGNAAVTEAGFVYSTTIDEPTISDNKTPVTDVDDFSIDLEGLISGTIYKIRAYAINKKGIGYGEVRSFETGNFAPVASDLQITGTFEVSKTLTATYTFTDAESDDEDITATGTAFQWFMADNSTGANETAIDGATGRTFVVADAQNGKVLRVRITPKATSGTLTGTEVMSPYTDEIGAETVTFTYMGQSVTYGTIISPVTQKKWMDRNLGATRVATQLNDYLAYGDLFQWGRAADGHQVVTRNGTANANVTFAVGTTSLGEPFDLSPDDTPDNNLFIVSSGAVDSPGDWRSTRNDNLWQGVNGTNNPCPPGWRIPTIAEWQAEGITSVTNLFERLKTPHTGLRRYNNGNASQTSVIGVYWSSTSTPTPLSNTFSFDAANIFSNGSTYRGQGNACRCIKN